MSSAANNEKHSLEPVVLVVGGSRENADLVRGILSVAGFVITEAPDGLKAFEQIGNQPPNLIIVDLGNSNPEAVEACRRFKENQVARQIPVIVMAAEADKPRVALALQAGAADYVMKPFGSEDLLARVRTHLELATVCEELTRNRNRLRELQAEKGEFLSIVAHDLRSPLSNIVTSANIVISDPELPREQINEFLEIIEASGRHMIHLVENLMDLNAIEQGRMKLEIAPCEIGEVVRGVAANYNSKAKAKQQELALCEDTGPLVAMADPHSAIQIFDNLVSNAIKYSPTGKRIDIRLSRRNGMIRCEVQDQGPGLSKDDLEKMFGKFAKLSAQPTGGEPSTGLGLSIVKKMVEAAGGSVWCESELGKGALFVVELRSAAHP